MKIVVNATWHITGNRTLGPLEGRGGYSAVHIPAGPIAPIGTQWHVFYLPLSLNTILVCKKNFLAEQDQGCGFTKWNAKFNCLNFNLVYSVPHQLLCNWPNSTYSHAFPCHAVLRLCTLKRGYWCMSFIILLCQNMVRLSFWNSFPHYHFCQQSTTMGQL